MRKMSRLLCLAFACIFVFGDVPAQGTSISGQSYDAFAKYYKEDVSFINDNDRRHLLPLILAKRTNETGDGGIYYELLGDTLNVVLTTEPTGEVIESCVITLTAPQGMEYGSAVYQDFAISGYHSFALLMAMHADPEPARRYELVTDVVNGMAEGNGAYTRQVGVYTLSCTRKDNVAVLEFHNNRMPEPPVPEESPSAEDSGGFETEDSALPDGVIDPEEGLL